MGPICLRRKLKLTSVELRKKLTPPCLMTKLQLLSLTMDPECARLELLVTTHPGVSSHQLLDGRSARVSWLAWDTRTVSWETRPSPRGASCSSNTPLSTASSPTGMTWRKFGTTPFTMSFG